MNAPKISLVVATYNRARALDRLLGYVSAQELPPTEFETIVAIDGSTDETMSVLKEWKHRVKFPLSYFWRENTGQSGARHDAIIQAQAPRIAVVDDDMELHPWFLGEHLRAAAGDEARTIVVGKIIPEVGWETKPLFEAARDHHMLRLHRRLEMNAISPSAITFATGNVSFPKSMYVAVGGFDKNLRYHEDVELAWRLQCAGGKFVFAPAASAIHHSNVGSYEIWERRQYEYGKMALQTWKKANKHLGIHPLQDYVEGSRLNRAIVTLLVRNDSWVRAGVSGLRFLGNALQRVHWFEPAFATHKAIRALLFHLGLKHGFGSWQAFTAAARQYAETSRNAPKHGA